VTIDSKKRAQGCRVRFRLKANAVKFYDHANVFRVEATINNPREFKVLRAPDDATEQRPRWCPMTKGVANFWRYAEVAHAANGRLLDALARVPLTGEATRELDALCRPGTATTTRVAAFNPVHPDTADLFAAVLSGDFAINGFRNRDLQGKLYPAAAEDAAETKRRTHRTSRLIAKVRGHGLITRIKTAVSTASPPAVSGPCGPQFASGASTSPWPSWPPKIPRPHKTSAVMSIPGKELHSGLKADCLASALQSIG
jgi:hypothetical protein